MHIPTCRVYSMRNSSSLILSSSPSNPIVSSSMFRHFDGELFINLISSIIFILSFIGNLAALLVMFGSRGPIRLTNNKYLVNLACADLLRACFMPFTIIARVKRNFIFGPLICKILPIVQGLSVAVDVFTLVCISIERYIAICRPLLILKLQSLRFANVFNALILFFIWFLALLIASPNLFMYHLCSLPRPNKFKCEKVQSKYFDERIYMIGLLIFYLLIPMLIMIVLYTLIICKMYKNSTAMKMRSFQYSNPSKTMSISSSPPVQRYSISHHRQRTLSESHQGESNDDKCPTHRSSFETIAEHSTDKIRPTSKSTLSQIDVQLNSSWTKHVNKSSSGKLSRSKEKHLLNSNSSRSNSNRSQRSSNTNPPMCRMDRHRRKALTLLIVIIVEFFICWTPLFLYHTFGTFFKTFYRRTPTFLLDLILLFSFASALTNPLTYYFMSKRYRSVLFVYLTCFRSRRNAEEKHRFQKNQEAIQVVKALRLHQQQNSFEYKPKNPFNLQQTKSRSDTLQ